MTRKRITPKKIPGRVGYRAQFRHPLKNGLPVNKNLGTRDDRAAEAICRDLERLCSDERLHDPAQAAVAGLEKQALIIFFGEENEALFTDYSSTVDYSGFLNGLQRQALIQIVTGNQEVLQQSAKVNLDVDQIKAMISGSAEHKRIQELTEQVESQAQALKSLELSAPV